MHTSLRTDKSAYDLRFVTFFPLLTPLSSSSDRLFWIKTRDGIESHVILWLSKRRDNGYKDER
jgi:hypothetical protein